MSFKKILIFISFIGFLMFLPQPILALKTRVRMISTGVSRTVSGRVTSSVRFKSGRNGIIISLSGLSNAESVSYELTYNTNGITQGAMGTISNITNSTDSRELLFGTCSGGVCRYHTNITNAKLIITSKLKSGTTTRKSYRLKV
ncbi:MAG: hypothetical protein NT052_01350 [Candidatus Shapirobacteria bacterium]|nr:hypothetical protein [Candidatus Shapirobacteria bacterium]